LTESSSDGGEARLSFAVDESAAVETSSAVDEAAAVEASVVVAVSTVSAETDSVAVSGDEPVIAS